MNGKNTSKANFPSGPEVPSKKSGRPRAYECDPVRYQTRFGRVPLTIRKEGTEEAIDNPMREFGVYVVHGIGQQVDTETAVNLRRGVEDVIPLIDPGHQGPQNENQWIVPPPYIYDGFWANYDHLKWLWGKEEYRVLTKRQRDFFQGALLSRSGGWVKNCGWLIKQGLKLLWSGGLHRWPVYFPLTLLCILIFILGIVPRFRRMLTQFVNDARLYLDPQGDIELETVQRIDYRVGEAFLKMLGLNWDFQELDEKDQIQIGGRPHRFKRVIWVGHSLGSVISYNVISDLLNRCEEVRRETPDRIANVEIVEQGLQHFITIGSPLDKVVFLFDALREWPAQYLSRGMYRTYQGIDRKLANSESEKALRVPFWLNFFYGSDPVSGPLDQFNHQSQPYVKNLSTVGWRVPLVSHVAYWKDIGIVSKVLELGYREFVKTMEIRFWPDRLHQWLSGIGIFTIAALVSVTFCGIWFYRSQIWALLLKFAFGS